MVPSVDRIKYAHDRGHQLGSHTWSHDDLTTLTWDQSRTSFISLSGARRANPVVLVHDEMWRVERACKATLNYNFAFGCSFSPIKRPCRRLSA